MMMLVVVALLLLFCEKIEELPFKEDIFLSYKNKVMCVSVRVRVCVCVCVCGCTLLVYLCVVI